MKFHSLCLSLALSAPGWGVCGVASPPGAQPPNIVVIMADDLGFSDLGSYGGEIRTPHIDRLAREGVRFSQFTNTGRCCPSRAALLTGRDPHTVGMGWMTAADEHRPGYRGQITDKVPTLAEILKDNGYDTAMSGKWHVTVDGNFKNVGRMESNGSWPTDRGFDEYFGGLSGGGGYYGVRSLLHNEEHIQDMPEDFYYTTAITENAVEFIEEHDPSKPFFLYLAHYAPHRPLQAPEERVEACRAMYSAGYDVLREARYQRLREEGLISPDEPLPLHEADYDGARPPWDSLTPEEKQEWIEEMATYAAMVEIMDDGIGEVIAALKAKGMYENTLILFLSDNGATMEGGDISKLAASLSNTPYRQFKQFTHFGGINSPLIIHYPKRFAGAAGTVRGGWGHIKDILPTVLDLAGIDYPKNFRGEAISPPDGISLRPALEGKTLPGRDLFYEHQTASAVISDGWKLVRLSSDQPWELYNLNEDPFEQRNLAEARPEIAVRMEKRWNEWAEKSHVLPLEYRPWRERVRYYHARFPDQDGTDQVNEQ